MAGSAKLQNMLLNSKQWLGTKTNGYEELCTVYFWSQSFDIAACVWFKLNVKVLEPKSHYTNSKRHLNNQECCNFLTGSPVPQRELASCCRVTWSLFAFLIGSADLSDSLLLHPYAGVILSTSIWLLQGVYMQLWSGRPCSPSRVETDRCPCAQCSFIVTRQPLITCR